MIFYFTLKKICGASNKFLYLFFLFFFIERILFPSKIKFAAYCTKLRGVARCTAIVAIRQMRGKGRWWVAVRFVLECTVIIGA